MSAAKPIIVIKKKGGHGGHHGGAWKVAYADFVTAMMALFIVLWLLSSSAKTKKAVAGYFNDPKSSQKELGAADKGDDGNGAPVDKKNAEALKEQIQKAIKNQKDLEKLSKQIEITITPEGLRIELIEDKSGTFFQSGSAKLSDGGQKLIGTLADQLKPLPNRLLLEGHTDAQPYASDNGYSNWELSADRANAARRLLQQDGVGKNQISQVRGYADQLLRVKSDPLDPTNRRISLIVQWADQVVPTGTPDDLKKMTVKDEKIDLKSGAKTGDGKPAEGRAGEAKPSAAAPEKAADKPAEGTKATTPEKPAAGTSAKAPTPDKVGLLDKLKSMLPGGKSAPKKE